MRTCQVYDPLPDKMPFIVCFETDGREHQEDRANRVIAYLSGLPQEDLVKESHKFYKFVVMYHIGAMLLHYTERLLRYFHSHGLLRCKAEINCITKQQKQRYLVMFDVGGQVFTQTYNSIRELKADTGKKPSQIKAELTETMVCKPIGA